MRLLDKDPFISENAFPLLEDDVSKLSTMSLKGHAASILDSVSLVNDPLTKLSLLGQYTEMQKELSKRGEPIEIPAFLSKDYMVPTLQMDQVITNDDLKNAELDSDQAFFDSFSSALEIEDSIGAKAPTDPLSQMFFQAPNLMDFDTNAFINESLDPGSIPMSDEEIAELEDSGFKESLWDPSEELRRHAALHQDDEFFTLEMEEAYINHLIKEETADLIRIPNALLPEKVSKDKVEEDETNFENIQTWLQEETLPTTELSDETSLEAPVEMPNETEADNEPVEEDVEIDEEAPAEDALDASTKDLEINTQEETETELPNSLQDGVFEESSNITDEAEVLTPHKPQDEIAEDTSLEKQEESECIQPNNAQEEPIEEGTSDIIQEIDNTHDEEPEEESLNTSEEVESITPSSPQEDSTEHTSSIVSTPETTYDPGQTRVDELKNKLLEIQEKKRKRAAELAKRKSDLI